MATWTRMKIEKQVKIEWATLGRDWVVCHTVYGDLKESVVRLREKLKSQNLLPPIREIFQDMLDFAESKNENKQDSHQGTQG